jgi:hypothetical protein
VGRSISEESAQNDPGVEPRKEESVQGSVVSWIRSILEELASTPNGAVRGAEGTSLCPGSKCGSTLDGMVVALVLIIGNALLVVTIALAIRARRLRLNTDPPIEYENGMTIRTGIADPMIPPRRTGA